MSFQQLKAQREASVASRVVDPSPTASSTATSMKAATTATPGPAGTDATNAESVAASLEGMNMAPAESPAPAPGSADAPLATPSTASTASKPPTTPWPESHLYPWLSQRGLEVRVSTVSGRGIYATRDIAAGTPLFRTQPRTAVLSSSKLQTHCSGCFQPGTATATKKVQRCAACKALHYCSAKCQKADWEAHKSECAALKRFRSMWADAYPAKARNPADNSWVLNEAVRALGRMCWARRAGRKGGVDADWWDKVALMATAPDEDMMQLMTQVYHLRHYLAAAEPPKRGDDPALIHPTGLESYGFKSDRELMDMCSAFMTNSFTLTTADLAPVGVATSPICALFNHGCDPSAVIVFPKVGTGMNVIAIANVEAGDEILTSYVDVSQPYPERQVEIRERYGFTCKCSLCLMPASWVDPRWCVRHVGCKQNGKGNMPDLGSGDAAVKCDACHEMFTVDADALEPLVTEAKQIVAQDDAGTLERAEGLNRLTPILAALSPLLPDSSHPLLQLLHVNALLLLPVTNDTDKARVIVLLARAIKGAGASYPTNHPAVALWKTERARLIALQKPVPSHLLSRSELQMQAFFTQAAIIPALGEAAHACRMAFGPDGDIEEGLETEADAAHVFVHTMKSGGGGAYTDEDAREDDYQEYIQGLL